MGSRKSKKSTTQTLSRKRYRLVFQDVSWNFSEIMVQIGAIAILMFVTLIATLLYSETVLLFYLLYVAALGLLSIYMFMHSILLNEWVWLVLWFWVFWMIVQYIWNAIQWYFPAFFAFIVSIAFVIIALLNTMEGFNSSSRSTGSEGEDDDHDDDLDSGDDDDDDDAYDPDTDNDNILSILMPGKMYRLPVGLMLIVFLALFLFPFQSQNPFVQGPWISITRMAALLWIVLAVQYFKPLSSTSYGLFLKTAWVLGVNHWFLVFVVVQITLLAALSTRQKEKETTSPAHYVADIEAPPPPVYASPLPPLSRSESPSPPPPMSPPPPPQVQVAKSNPHKQKLTGAGLDLSFSAK